MSVSEAVRGGRVKVSWCSNPAFVKTRWLAVAAAYLRGIEAPS